MIIREQDIEVFSDNTTSPSMSGGASPESTSNSSATSVESTKQPARRPRKKRAGAVVDALRSEIGVNAAPSASYSSLSGALVHLGPTSTTASLGIGQLQAALVQNLLTFAVGEVPAPSVPPSRDLADVLAKLRLDAVKPKTNPYSEILLSACIALGARRSNHSAITGGALTHTQLGEQRENSCRVLVDRAVDLAKQMKVVEANTPDAAETIEVLKVMLYACTPQHEYSDVLAAATIARYLESPSPGIRTVAGDSILIYDGITSCRAGRRCRIRNEDLHTYGWSPTMVLEAMELLDRRDIGTFFDHFATTDMHTHVNEPVIRAVRAASIYCLREACELSQIPITWDLTTVQDGIARLRPMIDIIERAVRSLVSVPAVFYTILIPRSLVLPLFLESMLVSTANRWCMGHASPDADDFYLSVLLPYLNWLAVFARYLTDLPNTEAGAHTKAIVLNSLDIFPGWKEAAIQAAMDHANGEGRLAGVGFTWDHLDCICEGFRQAATVFASSVLRERDLAAAIKRAERTGVARPYSDLVAQAMVEEVLTELE